MRSLNIDLFSDVICPWCYIGEQRFSAARQELEHPTDGSEPVSLAVRLRAFMLDPTWDPNKTQPVIDGYAAKFGGLEQATKILDYVTNAAAETGIEFHMDRAQRANTMRAHRLNWWAAQPGSTIDPMDMNTELMRAYFTDGRNISSIDTLTEIASGLGADADTVAAFLHSNEGEIDVASDLQMAADMGVTGVPTFVVVDSQWAVSGAQEPDTLVRTLRKVAANQG